jgi:hypothetical protein
MEQLPQSTTGLQKILAGPVKTYVVQGKEKFTCWIHPLSEREQLSVEAVALENLHLAVKEKIANDEAVYRYNRAEICQRLFYSIRTGDKPGNPDQGGSPRLFTERMVAYLDHKEANRLAIEYKDAFVPTEEERKNYFREKLGPGSEILSTSPKGTASRRSSRKGR